MICVSSKGVYGLAAMFYLAKSRENLVQIREIAENGEIPQNYLEQLLIQLKKAGFVESIRGAKGGYRLAMDPERLTVFEILIALEGDHMCCDQYTSVNKFLNLFWSETASRIQDALSTTLQELVDRSQQMESGYMYYI